MSIARCIREKAASGLVDRESAEFLARIADDVEQASETAGEATPGVNARTQAVEAGRHALAKRRLARRAQAVKEARAVKDVEAFPIEDKSRFERAMNWLRLDLGTRVGSAPISIFEQQQVHVSRAWSQASELLESIRPKLAGLAGRESIREIEHDALRFIYGEETQTEIGEVLGRQMQAVTDYFPGQFRKQGVFIKKTPKYAPQRHSSLKTSQMPRSAWVRFMRQRANREEMIDQDTGQPFTIRKLDEVLGRMYDSIVRGDDKGRDTLAQLTSERFFIFKNSDSYLEWRDRFSDESSLLDALAGFVEYNALRLARVEAFGPFPGRTMERINTSLGRSQATPFTNFSGTYHQMSGSLDAAPMTGGFSSKLVSGVNAVRQTNLASILGSAVVPAMADITFMSNSLRLMGTRSPFFRSMFRVTQKALDPNSKQDRLEAQRQIFLLEGAMSRTGSSQRFEMDEALTGLPRKTLDTVLRMSGLTWITDNARLVGFELIMKDLSRVKARPFNELDEQLQQTFRRAGIEEADWDVIRSSFGRREDGFEFIEPQRIFENDEEVGSKFMRLIHKIKESGSPMKDPQVRYALTAGGRDPNTAVGALTRLVTSLMFWPTAILHQQNQVRKGLMNPKRKVALTMMQLFAMGVVITQLKDITKGRTPRGPEELEEDPLGFAAEAFARSGAGGILGDWLWTSAQYGGPGFARALAGPGANAIGDGLSLTLGNMLDATREDKDTNFGRDLVGFMEQMTPGKTLWFAELALERALFDEIQRAVDPNADASFRAEEQSLKRRKGTEFLVEPGSVRPFTGN